MIMKILLIYFVLSFVALVILKRFNLSPFGLLEIILGIIYNFSPWKLLDIIINRQKYQQRRLQRKKQNMLRKRVAKIYQKVVEVKSYEQLMVWFLAVFFNQPKSIYAGINEIMIKEYNRAAAGLDLEIRIMLEKEFSISDLSHEFDMQLLNRPPSVLMPTYALKVFSAAIQTAGVPGELLPMPPIEYLYIKRDDLLDKLNRVVSTFQSSTEIKAGSKELACPMCGTIYNRIDVIKELKKQSPEIFDFAIWTAKFYCTKCREEIKISGHRGE